MAPLPTSSCLWPPQTSQLTWEVGSLSSATRDLLMESEGDGRGQRPGPWGLRGTPAWVRGGGGAVWRAGPSYHF